MSVQFSELHGIKGRLSWSPSGELLATTEGNQLMIRSGDSLQIINVHSCVDLIDKIEWSSNSEYILCLIRKRGIIMIWSISDIKWEAKIEEGLAGLTNAFWSPDNKHIITVSEFEIRLTIWSLIDGKAKYIKYPKHNSLGIKFSHNGKYLAVTERSNHVDILGIYSVQYWQLIHRFNINSVSDLHDIEWSFDDQYILCINNELSYKFAVYTPRGRKVFDYSAYENALGIRCFAWSPNDKYVSIGSYDNMVRIFNTMTWRIVSEFKCNPVNEQYTTKSTICYQEIGITNVDKKGHKEEVHLDKTRYALCKIGELNMANGSKAKQRNIRNLDGESRVPMIGVVKCEWSHDSRFVAVISQNMDRIVWIWDMKYLVFHSILSHKQPVRTMSWNNVNHKLQLAVSCNNDRLYLWSKSGSVVIRVVASRFNVRRVTWRPMRCNDENHSPRIKRRRSKYQSIVSKDCICLIDRNHFCCCYDLDF
eukprot:290652_1